MSYTFLQEQGEESSVECFSDIPPYVLSRLNHTDEKSSCSDSETEYCPSSLSGMMSEPLTASLGQKKSILLRRASRATTSLRRGKRLASMARNLPSSMKFAASHLKYNRDTCFWKIAGTLWEEDLPESSVSLPGWGMLQSGVVWEPDTLEPTTKGFGLGLFPTPMAGDKKWSGTFQEGSGSFNKWRETWLGVQWINPGFWEEIMGWPIGWTCLQPLGRDKFRQWLHSHGEF